MLEQVGKAGLQGGQVFTPQLGLGAAPVVLEGADSSHHHHRIGVEPGQTALNIQELSAPRSAPKPASVIT